MTLIQWNTNQNTSDSTMVPMDGLLTGIGSKQVTLNYSGVTDAIVVDHNARANHVTGQYDKWQKTARIENLVIDGQNVSNGATGIVLSDVYNSLIRNLTIRNFSVGIRITATNLLDDGVTPMAPNWSEANRIMHVRMENVETGILFDSGTGTGSFACTTIDDVGIQLANDASAVGIQIGTSNNSITAQPYSSRIKANVWEQSAGGTGMKLINGEVKYGLINLAVQGPSNGYGIDLNSQYTYPTGQTGDKRVYHNQFSVFDSNDNVTKEGFLLACDGLSSSNGIIWNGKPQTQEPLNDINLVSY